MQDENSFKIDFLGPYKDVSPLSYLVDQRCLSRQEFMHHAEFYFKGSSQAQKFIDRLVHTFHSISGDTESVSWNADIVLDRLFNGQFSLSSIRGQPTYGVGAQGRMPQPQRSHSWGARTTRETNNPVTAQGSRSADVKPRDEDFQWPAKSSHQASASPLLSHTNHEMSVHSTTYYNGHEQGAELYSGNSSVASPDIVCKTFPSQQTYFSNLPSSQSRPTTTAQPSSIHSHASNMSMTLSPERFRQSTTTTSTERQEATPTPSQSITSYDGNVSFDSPGHLHGPETTRASDMSLSSTGDSIIGRDGVSERHVGPSPSASEGPITTVSVTPSSETAAAADPHSASVNTSNIDSPRQPPHRTRHTSDTYPKDWTGLQCYINEKELTFTGISLGVGRYGSVEVVIYKGRERAAKSFHKQFSDEQQSSLVKKFHTEFKILSCLSHDNIVEYIGATPRPSLSVPVLIMEKLATNLKNFLETTKNPGLPLHLKLSILYDTANGLHFLHTRKPAVIHRDITATNVLLDSNNRAKIADFGNSCIIDANVDTVVSMTCNPGTPLYAAPEVIEKVYGTPIDVFSFGHLSLFTIGQVEPTSLLRAKKPLDDGTLGARTEVERRASHFETVYRYLERDHAIIEMIKQCLHDAPNRRHTTLYIIEFLEEELKKH